MSGRGRLSSIDLLPDEAADDVIWAVEQLNGRQRSQADILFELNDRLEAKGLDGISKSAFNRKAVRLARNKRRLDEGRHIFAGMARDLTPEAVDESSLVIGEMIKLLVAELLDDPVATPKEAAELARAYQSTIRGQLTSAERRRRLEADYRAKAEKAVERAAMEAGLSAERAAALRHDILGVPAGRELVDDVDADGGRHAD